MNIEVNLSAFTGIHLDCIIDKLLLFYFNKISKQKKKSINSRYAHLLHPFKNGNGKRKTKENIKKTRHYNISSQNHTGRIARCDKSERRKNSFQTRQLETLLAWFAVHSRGYSVLVRINGSLVRVGVRA